VIDKQKALAALEANNYNGLSASVVKECIKVIQDLPEDEGWISVKDRLPEPDERFEDYNVKVSRSHFPTSSYDPVDAPYEEEYITTALFDGDQKIWHLLRIDEMLNALIMPEDSPLNGDVVTHWKEVQ